MRRTVKAVLFAGALLDGGAMLTGADGIASAAQAPAQIVTYTSPTAAAVFPGATVNDGSLIRNASVQIASGLVPSEDRLALQSVGAAVIASSYNAATGTLSLAGTATGAEWATILKAVRYSNSAPNPNNGDRVIVAQLGAGTFLQATGHYYELVATPAGQPVSWAAARTDAASRRNLGLVGYLATIGSKAEQSFVAGLAAGNTVWLGANDTSTPDTWRWMTGPEGAQAGGTGLAFYNTGGPLAGGYNNWSTGQPLRSATVNFSALAAGGQWTSLVSGGPTGGYVVEYGGLGTTPAFFDRFSTTVHVQDAP